MKERKMPKEEWNTHIKEAHGIWQAAWERKLTGTRPSRILHSKWRDFYYVL